MDVVEIIGASIGLLYLFLEYKANVWLWPVGIVMSAFYVVIYATGRFYADAALNVYYIFANIYGLAVWTFRKRTGGAAGNTATDELTISRTPKKKILPLAVSAGLLWLAIYLVLGKFTDSPVPVGDAFTTSLSIVAMWMLAHKYLEQWLLWIVVDVVSVALYFWKGLYPTAVLYIVYVVVAVMGYISWKRQYVNSRAE